MQTETEDATHKADAPDDGASTLDIVRRLIDESAITPEPVAEPVVKTRSEPEPAPARTSAQPAPLPPVAPIVQSTPPAPFADEAAEPDWSEDRKWWVPLLAWVRRELALFFKRREAPREIATALLAIFAILFPGFVAAFIVVAIVSAAIVWLTLGPDYASEMIVTWHTRLAEREPERAETIRRRAARVSAKVTSLVDRLPDRWTTGLSIPDFEPMDAPPEKLKDDPFDRLAAQLHAGEGAQP